MRLPLMQQSSLLVRLERCSSLAGESPVVVIAREPRSNPPVPRATGGAEARVSTPRRRSDTAVRTMKRNPAAPIGIRRESRACQNKAKAKEEVKNLEEQPRRTPRRKGNGMW